MNLSISSIESMFDSVSPEILGSLDGNILSPDNDNNLNLNNIIKNLYDYLPDKSIIEILNDIRENKNAIIYESFESALTNMIQNKEKITYISENKNNEIKYLNDNTIIFPLKHLGETIESLVISDLTKIKNIRIYEKHTCNYIFNSLDRLDYTQTKEYKLHNANKTINGLLISNYNIPMISVHYQELNMELEFIDNYIVDRNINEEIIIIHTLLDNNFYGMFNWINYELDTQPGRFVVFMGGMTGEHYSHDNGDLSDAYQSGKLDKKKKKLFDLAHIEANRRKNLNKKLNI